MTYMQAGLQRHTGVASNDYVDVTVPSPYMAKPIQPFPRNPNILGPWLVLHRTTLATHCVHQTEAGARLCANGIRCTKGRSHYTKYRDAE